MTADTPGIRDELEDSLTEWLRDPVFARAWTRVNRRHPWTGPKPWCINGHEYARRRKSRRRKNQARGR